MKELYHTMTFIKVKKKKMFTKQRYLFVGNIQTGREASNTERGRGGCGKGLKRNKHRQNKKCQ